MIAIEYVRNLVYCREIIICIEKILTSLPPLHYHLGRGLIKENYFGLIIQEFYSSNNDSKKIKMHLSPEQEE